ncbi:glycosyltransferase family 2 protein [Chitinophagaceae bacterium LWZ2-11]
MPQPKVSVIIPTYNYAFYIEEAINSILKQTYPIENIEIIVVDDGSTDDTQKILQALIDNKTITYYYQENKGKANATYTAIQKSTGKYIFNLDADDYFFEDKISSSVQIFETDDEIVHVANPAKFIIDGSDAGEEILPEEIIEKKQQGEKVLMLFYNKRMLFGGGSTFSGRGNILRSIFISDAVDMYIDEFLVIALLNEGSTFFIRKPLSVWRGHNNNYTVQKLSANTKNIRLAKSSKGILDLVKEGNYPIEIKKLYELHHQTRTIFLKESMNKKRISDIIALVKFSFFKNRFTLKQLRAYSVFNRLIPNYIIRILKRQH